jgi:hypothetical protein
MRSNPAKQNQQDRSTEPRTPPGDSYSLSRRFSEEEMRRTFHIPRSTPNTPRHTFPTQFHD